MAPGGFNRGKTSEPLLNVGLFRRKPTPVVARPAPNGGQTGAALATGEDDIPVELTVEVSSGPIGATTAPTPTPSDSTVPQALGQLNASVQPPGSPNLFASKMLTRQLTPTKRNAETEFEVQNRSSGMYGAYSAGLHSESPTTFRSPCRSFSFVFDDIRRNAWLCFRWGRNVILKLRCLLRVSSFDRFPQFLGRAKNIPASVCASHRSQICLCFVDLLGFVGRLSREDRGHI
eukprot:GHVT01105010.1.p1 GENE.GHVT01105010.1~~GHVT01105010.1.p1  ORF type:complete len:232 (-),score=25.72 GHVT01105010.1:19-714(-)